VDRDDLDHVPAQDRELRWSSSSGPAAGWCCRWAAWRRRRLPSWTRTIVAGSRAGKSFRFIMAAKLDGL